MPELPEVETLRRGLAERLPGRRFTAVDVRLPKLVKPDPGFSVDDILNREVRRIRRRAKMLIVDLAGGVSLLFHLKLAGQIVLESPDGERLNGGHPVPAWGAPLPHKGTHVIFSLDDGSTLYLTDIRQFGWVRILATDEVERVLEGMKLGPEPLEDGFDRATLKRALGRRKGKIKPVLLDQGLLAGLGNIYVDEALWEARIHPERSADSLAPQEITRLYEAIKHVLNLAVTEGVAEILNGRARGDRGFPRAHGRAGLPCPRCETPIVRLKVAQRSSYVCPKEQRLTRGRTTTGHRAGRTGAGAGVKRTEC